MRSSPRPLRLLLSPTLCVLFSRECWAEFQTPAPFLLPAIDRLGPGIYTLHLRGRLYSPDITIEQTQTLKQTPVLT